MVTAGETITIETLGLTNQLLREIRQIKHVFSATYNGTELVVKCSDGKHNVIRILNSLQEHNIGFGRIFSELPTLNDVFLEITETDLRD